MTVRPQESLITSRAGGLRWLVRAEFEPALTESVLPALQAAPDGSDTLIKRSVSRAIHCVPVGERSVYVKHHQPKSSFERLKFLLLKSRAETEWNAAEAMLRHGIPVARPLAFGERRVAGLLCEAVLVSEAIDNAVELGRALTQDEPGELIDRVARLVRSSHDARILHRDLHGGNILVQGDKLFFIDVHRSTLGRRISRDRRAWNIGQLFAFLGDKLTGQDHQRFLRTYLGSDRKAEAFGRSVRRQMAAIRERRYASRTKRCVKKSSGFRRESVDGMTVFRRKEFSADQIRQALEQHRAAQGDAVLKADRRARVTRVALATGEAVCVKEFLRKGWLRRLADAVVGSRGRKAWLASHALAVRGIPTPRALALAEAGGRSFFITDYIEGTVDLPAYISDHGRPTGRDETRHWRRLVATLADLFHRLHSHRIEHHDLKAGNILARERDGQWELYVIDVNDVRLGREPSLELKLLNLSQIDHNAAPPSRTDRLRFFHRYAPGIEDMDARDMPVEIAQHTRRRRRAWLAKNGMAILEERLQQGKPI